jgi:N-acetylglucosamine-6-phosphate deacetylase
VSGLQHDGEAADISDASLQVASEAVDKGARMITHLFKYVQNS